MISVAFASPVVAFFLVPLITLGIVGLFAAIDPGEVLLRLVTQSAARAERYAAELEDLVQESPSLREALIAEVWVSTEHGESYKAGEYVRGLAKLEAEERDRCASFATKAVAAGLAERQVRLAECLGELLALGDPRHS